MPPQNSSVMESEAIDADLVERAKDGNSDAFATLMNRHGGLVYMICRHRLDDRDVADVYQEIWFAVWRRMQGGLVIEDTFRAWLSRVCVNRCATHLETVIKRRHVISATDCQSVDSNWTLEYSHIGKFGIPQEVLEQAEVVAEVNALVAALPDERTREAIHLYFVEGLTYEAIGEIFVRNKGTIMARVQRGLLTIRTQLEQKYPDSS